MVLIGLSLLLPHPEPSLPSSLHALSGRLPAKGGVGVGLTGRGCCGSNREGVCYWCILADAKEFVPVVEGPNAGGPLPAADAKPVTALMHQMQRH